MAGVDQRAVDAFDAAIEVLGGRQDAADPSRTAEAAAEAPLWFDGGSWLRRPMRPGEDADLHGKPWPRRLPETGWWLFSRHHQARDQRDVGGVVIDLLDARDDPDTGERHPAEWVVASAVYETKTRLVQLAGGVTDLREYEALIDVRRLPLQWDDIASATPARRSLLQQTYDDLETVLSRRHIRNRHADQHVDWLRHARHVLEGLLAA